MTVDRKLYITPLAEDSKALKREFRKRNTHYRFQNVDPGLVDSYSEQGWERFKKLKRTVKVRKVKPIDERLEDRVWVLLYRMGYPTLNAGRQFKISLPGASSIEKQIDIFAKDDETVIVAECKASESPRRRSLQKDLAEFANLKGKIANSVRKHYGEIFKPKIIWLFVTENILWSSQDADRAKSDNIAVVTERELRYFSALASHLGSAARYQFLAEFLSGQSIPGLEDRRIPAIRGKLGGRRFYCFVATPRDMLKISFVNHRSLRHPEGTPTYQRLIQKGRLRNVSQFLLKGGFFPTNLIVNFTDRIRFDIVTKSADASVHYGNLYLPARYRSAWVIDGQHRLYAYAHTDEKHLNSNLLVLAFEGMPKEEEANLFVTINHEQKTVARNLLDELEGELKWGSDNPKERLGSIASRLIDNLKADVSGPFAGRIAEPGIASRKDTPINVPEFKKGLIASGLLGVVATKQKVLLPGPLSGRNDYETLDRAQQILTSLFSEIREANFSRWEAGRSGFLCTNHGAQGYLKLFATVIDQYERDARITAHELETGDLLVMVSEHLQPIVEFVAKASDEEFQSRFKVRYGSSGAIDYLYELCRILGPSMPQLAPDGFEEWKAAQSEENISKADQQIKAIATWVQATVFRVFKEKYGDHPNDYWEKGVKNADLKTQAFKASLDYPPEERLALENYLDFIKLKELIERKEHWPWFKPIFDIAEPSEPKGRAKNLAWMDKINQLRRIPAHPTEQRRYKADDFIYIEWLYNELRQRLSRTPK